MIDNRSHFRYKGIQLQALSYLFPDIHVQNSIDKTTERALDLTPKNIKGLSDVLGLTFVPEQESEGNTCFADNREVREEYRTTFASIDLLDYIYAVLHSPTYHEKHKDFLKIDFPKVTYSSPPQSSIKEREQTITHFWKLVALGGELRQIHLLESPKVENYIASFPKDGSNRITYKIAQKDWEMTSRNPSQEGAYGRIWINDEQCFDNMPLVAWEFYIGSWRPAQKWLKDRRGRILETEDVLHYQKIIVALFETDRIRKEIENITID